MSGILPFIPKEHPEIPDYYGIKIYYLTGKTEEFEGIHTVIKDTSTIEISTKDDVWNLIPLSSIIRIEFDKRFSKYIEIKRKALEEARKKKEVANAG